MKMKKSMAMRKKAMKKSVIAKGYKTRSGAARAVFSGRKMKTVGGLTKDKLTKNKVRTHYYIDNFVKFCCRFEPMIMKNTVVATRLTS